MNKKCLFVDMDGTLAEFKPVDTLEKLYEEGYFLNLKPQMNVVIAIKDIIKNNPDIEVYIMSSVLSDSKYALEEKNKWIDFYLPDIEKSHRIFPPCGEDKIKYIPENLYERNNYLLDDYTKNLVGWEPPGIGIKLLNGINDTHKSWKGKRVDYYQTPDKLAGEIVKIINSEKKDMKKQLYQGRCR